MYYPEELVEEVRARNDIVEVVSAHVRLTRRGNNHFGLCPFHSEKTASFSVSAANQMYHCFGCGVSGNVYTFVMAYENYTFPEAIKTLAERAGISLPEVEYSEEARRRENRRARLLEVNREAAKFYRYQLQGEAGQQAKNYLLKRGLTEETMHAFALGYSLKQNNVLLQYLNNKGYENDLIREAGLAVFSEKQGLNERFWNRVMFPIMDINNKFIGFGGRVMGEGEPKYLNTAETPVFDKGRNLYGLNYARKARSSNFILCEGYMDVIALHQAGFTQAVASLGTALTAGQAGLLRRYEREIILAYDSDAAGEKAALRAVAILRECGLAARALSLAPCKDPDEFIGQYGPEGFEQRIKEAETSFFYELAVAEKGYNLGDPEQKTRFHREIAERLCSFAEEVERDNYLQAVCERYQINRENMRKLVVSQAAKLGRAKPLARPRSGKAERAGPEEYACQAEQVLLTWLAEEPLLYQKVKEYLTPADFTSELGRAVAERLFAELEAGKANPAALVSHFADAAEQQAAAAYFNTRLDALENEAEREKAFNEVLRTVKKNSYENAKEQLGSDIEAIAQAVALRKSLDELLKTTVKL
jgi:DNA primase